MSRSERERGRDRGREREGRREKEREREGGKEERREGETERERAREKEKRHTNEKVQGSRVAFLRILAPELKEMITPSPPPLVHELLHVHVYTYMYVCTDVQCTFSRGEIF